MNKLVGIAALGIGAYLLLNSTSQQKKPEIFGGLPSGMGDIGNVLSTLASPLASFMEGQPSGATDFLRDVLKPSATNDKNTTENKNTTDNKKTTLTNTNYQSEAQNIASYLNQYMGAQYFMTEGNRIFANPNLELKQQQELNAALKKELISKGYWGASAVEGGAFVFNIPPSNYETTTSTSPSKKETAQSTTTYQTPITSYYTPVPQGFYQSTTTYQTPITSYYTPVPQGFYQQQTKTTETKKETTTNEAVQKQIDLVREIQQRMATGRW
jgi:hypothetical protein